ncbi:MAG: DUF4097 family beta strand repeat protein, partial [Candidatus Zixiibacteriota bacterium]
MRSARLLLLVVMAVLLLVLSAQAGSKKELVKNFEAKEYVKVSTVSGDCIIRKGEPGKITVEVNSSVRPSDAFEPKFRERSNSLVLEEEMYGSCYGESEWILTVPEGTRVKFSTASGDLLVEDMKGDFEASTASGDAEIVNCRGEFEFSTASGDVEMTGCSGDFHLETASGEIDFDDCQGYFNVSTASGDIEAVNVTLEGRSAFSTASGTSRVVVAASPEHDLKVSTASGRAILDYNGNTLTGRFELIAKERSGDIDAPFDFDNV